MTNRQRRRAEGSRSSRKEARNQRSPIKRKDLLLQSLSARKGPGKEAYRQLCELSR